MKLQFENLVLELEQLAALNRELVGACRAKLSAMRTADARAINDVGKREGRIIEAIRLHESRRREICDAVAARLGMAAGSVLRVSELARYLPQPYAGRVLALTASLKQSMAEIQRVNRINQAVSEQVQRCFGDALAAMSEANAGVRTYGRSGRFGRPARVSLFSATA